MVGGQPTVDLHPVAGPGHRVGFPRNHGLGTCSFGYLMRHLARGRVIIGATALAAVEAIFDQTSNYC
jgi:alkylation response protein AidB-like acyl-CoA dehydrogenase